MKVDLKIKIRSLEFANPILTASGTGGYGLILNKIFDVSQLGGIITKTITLKPRYGNPPPRITETACGMLNSIGLENNGIESFIQQTLPQIKTLKTNIIASIAGQSREEFAELAERLDPLVDAIEVNISCPNVEEGGMAFGQNTSTTERVVADVRKRTSLPLIIKLTPNVTRIEDFARVCENSGADAVSLVNTYKGLSIDIHKRKSRIGGFSGGLSGPAIKPLALYAVWTVSQNISLPVIGCGGITNSEDAVEFFMVGASLIEIGSATFRNPSAPLKILKGLEDYLEKEGLRSVKDITGIINE